MLLSDGGSTFWISRHSSVVSRQDKPTKTEKEKTDVRVNKNATLVELNSRKIVAFQSDSRLQKRREEKREKFWRKGASQSPDSRNRESDVPIPLHESATE